MTIETGDLNYVKLLPEVRKIINEVVRRNMAEGILFSAGTDTSVIVFEAMKYSEDLKGVTVEFEYGSPKDTQYVKKMVKFLNLEHEFLRFGNYGLVQACEKVVEILKTFNDMEVRNSIPIYIGLVNMKKKKAKSVLTGDGLDELFGYPWQFHLSKTEFQQALAKMWSIMQFSSTDLGKAVGVEVKQPYLDSIFVDYAKGIPVELKVKTENGIKYGKWLIRKAYENLIPEEVVWRSKAPCEQGTGTDIFPAFFEDKIENEEFESKRKAILDEDKVNISTKEQLFYYELFRKKFGKPSESYNDKNGKQCPNCKGYVNKNITCCKICGAFPI